MNESFFRIRKAKLSDIPAIVKVHRTCVSLTNAQSCPPKIILAWLKDITRVNTLLQFKASQWLVAESNQAGIVGFGQYSLESGEVFQINVLPIYQKQGVGQALFKKMLADFTGHKKQPKITLNSTLNAVGFYQKLGFREQGKIEYPVGSQKVEMVKMERWP